MRKQSSTAQQASGMNVFNEICPNNLWKFHLREPNTLRITGVFHIRINLNHTVMKTHSLTLSLMEAGQTLKTLLQRCRIHEKNHV